MQGKDNPKISFISSDSTVTLKEPEIANFKPLKTDLTEKIETTTLSKVIQFTKLNFKGRRGWSVASEDGFEAAVTILDDDFMQKIAANEEAFQKDKLYNVEIQKKDVTDLGGTRTSYGILKVIG